jgi:ADP-dependent NAD(P)H-hydrate dehydratase / NAD(P)H-hydrate epimerase
MIHILGKSHTPAGSFDLYGVAATRQWEQNCALHFPAHRLMQNAGLAVARLALAVAPHAKTVWIACGPGNNGGDGLEAALHLQRWGKNVVVSWLGTPENAPADALLSLHRATQAGVTFAGEPPANFDLCIDALLGIGGVFSASNDLSLASALTAKAKRSDDGRFARWTALMNQSTAPTLAVDLPSGLNADTGIAADVCVIAQVTLSLLTLKPGLFTAHGRDRCGDIWFDALDTIGPFGAIDDRQATPAAATSLASPAALPTARLAGAPDAQGSWRISKTLHSAHKGSFGDVLVIGGAPGMTGAALLAASAALHSGAGRVFVGLLDGGTMAVDTRQPELMFRDVDKLVENLSINGQTVVCGCGGGDIIRHHLPRIFANPGPVVADADALNAIAADVQLQHLLQARSRRFLQTVLTPHPLEAARLLGIGTKDVQNNRLAAAQQLADKFGCVVVLKGSGSVIAAPGCIPTINPTGNARLATAGTGDVLAGMIGAKLASQAGEAHAQSANRRVHAASENVSRTAFQTGFDGTLNNTSKAAFEAGLKPLSKPLAKRCIGTASVPTNGPADNIWWSVSS